MSLTQDCILDILLEVKRVEAGMSRWAVALRLTGVGFFIGGSIAFGVFTGLWLDSKLGMNLFWLVGLILGLAVAFYGVFRMLLPLIGSKGDEENN